MPIKFLMILLFSFISKAGEIDGKGVVCNVYGDTVGFFFENDRVNEYRIEGGEEKLELSKKDKGSYKTNENAIYFGETRIDRKTLKYHKFSSFRGDCKVFDDFDKFKKSINIKELTKENKI